jgi:hypothetical protein
MKDRVAFDFPLRESRDHSLFQKRSKTMQPHNPIQPTATSLVLPGKPTRNPIRAWLGSPRGLIISGIVIIAIGLALGWNWVVAFGLAPLILSVAPCAAMCALGMCMMPKRGAATAIPAALEKTKPSSHE